MAWRLSDQVLRGELLNLRNYSTHGWIQIRGEEQPLHLELTGNCDPDLRGKHVRFVARDVEAREASGDDEGGNPRRIAWQQVGPTGTMTADRQVKVSDCPVEELIQRTKLGEPPPFEWKRCLYLEWYSQNGRVVVELVDPLIEFVDPQSKEAAEEWPPCEPDADQGAADAGIVDMALDAGEAEAEKETVYSLDDEEDDDADSVFGEDDSLEIEDPYGLIPDDLQRQLDADARATDEAFDSDEEKSDSIREMELMDDLIERGEGELIGSLFDSPLRLARPEQLSDEQVEPALKSLLGELALLGIAIDVCEHYSPREVYRLLLETICKEERAYPELRNTQWVQHFATSDFCEKCDAEFEEKYQQREKQNDPLPKPEDDDEMPF